MTTSLGKRSSTNGISDIAYKDEKAPVYTSTDQFVQGTKTFNAPIKFLNNVLCSAYYYGDGSHLTNVTGTDSSKLPLTGGTLTGNLTLTPPAQFIGDGSLITNVVDATKLPLAGGTMTGPIIVSDPGSLPQVTLSHENIEITDTVDQIAAIGFNPGTILDPKVYLQNGVNTLQMSATNVEITGAGAGQNALTNAGSVLTDYTAGRTVTNTYSGTEYYDVNVHGGTYCRAGSSLISNWSGFDVQTYGGSLYSASLGFYSSFGVNPILQLTTPVDNTEWGASALTYTNLTTIGPYPENFKFKADTNFFKFDCGSSYRIREHDGQKVNKDDAIIVTPQSISNYDFKVYEEYLDSNGQGGFSVIIIHPGSVPDPTITTPDLVFVTSQFGVTTNFTLPKWTTARFILTPTDPAIGYPNNFVWMVSW